MPTFRIHFADQSKIDIEAATPAAASAQAAKQHPSVVITKVKRVKGGA